MWKLVSHASGHGQYPGPRQLLRDILSGAWRYCSTLSGKVIRPKWYAAEKINRETVRKFASKTGAVLGRTRSYPLMHLLCQLYRRKRNKLEAFTYWWSRSFTSESFPHHSPPRWRVLFFGTDEFALETLKVLHNEMRAGGGGGGGCVSDLEVVCARMRTLVPAVARYTAAQHLPLHPWPPENLQPGRFDVGVVASFGHLIPGRVIDAFPHGMLNVHGSLLPRLRGAAPIIHAIREGMTETGLTVMKIKAGRFDVGNILASETVTIGDEEKRPELTQRMAETGAALLLTVLRDLERYEAESRPQPLEGVSYAPAVDKSLAFIDFNSQVRCFKTNICQTFAVLRTGVKPVFSAPGKTSGSSILSIRKEL